MTFILYVANNSGRDKAVAELQDMNLLAFWWLLKLFFRMLWTYQN